MPACLGLNTMPCTYTDGVSKNYIEYMILAKNKCGYKVLGRFSCGLEASLKAISKEELRNVILKMTSENLCTVSIWISQFWPLDQKIKLCSACLRVGNVIVALVPKDASSPSVSFLPVISASFHHLFVVIPQALSFKRGDS